MRQYKGWVAVDEDDGITYVITDSFNIDKEQCQELAAHRDYQLVGTIPAILTVDDTYIDELKDIKEKHE